MTGVVVNDAQTVAYDLENTVSGGWERNASGKLAPRMADLGALMDPKRSVQGTCIDKSACRN